MSQVRIFLKTQDQRIDFPSHRCSKTLASLLSSNFPRLVRYDKSSAILELLTTEAWSSVKARLRPKTLNGVRVVPRLNPPDSYLLMALQSYPEPNRCSLIHPHEAFLRQCQEAKRLCG